MGYIGKLPETGRYAKLDQINTGFNNSTTTFNTTVDSVAVYPGTPQNLVISLGGVIQQPGTDYTVSGSTLTFTTAPTASTVSFFGVLLGDTMDVGVVSDGTITVSKMAANSVDSDQYVDGSIDTVHIGDNQVTGTKIAMGSDARGDVLVYDGTNYIRLGADNGKFLRSNGTGSNPSWETVSSGGGDFTDGGDTASATMILGTNNAHALEFETAGTSRIHIAGATAGNTEAGWVGMGTTTPVRPLDLRYSGSRAQMRLARIGSATGEASLGAGDGMFSIMDGSYNRLVNVKTSNGYVGIGTGNSEPSTLLHVYGTGTVYSTVETTSTTSGVGFEVKKAASSTGGTIAYYWTMGSGNGSAGNKKYEMGYTNHSSWRGFYFWAADAGGASSANTVWRIPENQMTIDANTTWDNNAFDLYDDAKVLERAFSPAQRDTVYQDGKAILKGNYEELIEMGVLKKYPDDWVGYNDQRMAALLAGGIYQTRHRLDDSYEELKAEIKELKEEVAALRGN